MLLKDAKEILKHHKNDLYLLGVRKLALFGSTVRNEQSAKSDIDILVDFDSKMGMFVFLDLKKYLEKILEAQVDLVTKNALHPALKEKILRESKDVF